MTGGLEKPFGRYRLMRELGRGGEATVYLAEDPVLGRSLAVKIFPPAMSEEEEASARFRREVSLLARIDSPGICTIHDAGVIEGSPFIAMAYVEGRTLAERRPSGREEAIALIAKVAAVVQAAHEAGVVHGDLKPGNILVTPDDRCVVLDFGIARLVDDARQPEDRGRLAGTLPYLAPECLSGPPSAAADVFSLGAVLFELVSGRTPFVGPTRAALVDLILRDEPPLLRSVDRSLPGDLEAVLARALQRDPSRRYPSMSAFESDLGRLLQGQLPEARRYGPIARGLRWGRRRPALATLLVFVLGFLAIAVPIAASKNRDLEEYRDQAAEEARRAVLDARSAEVHLHRRERLADRRRLQDLEDQSRRLVPPRPEIAGDLAAWLGDAQALVHRLGEHKKSLEELRERGTKRSSASGAGVQGGLRREIASLRARAVRLEERSAQAAEPGARASLAAAASRARKVLETLESRIPKRDSWVYASPTDAWHDATLSELIADLERFADPDRSRGSVADVAARVTEARLVSDTVEKNREAWDRARASIEDRRACPIYDGLAIRPQPGLVPLRRNPETGLWEFLHVLSGAPPDAGREDAMSSEEGIVLVLLPGAVAEMGARRPATGEPPNGPHLDAMAAPQESPIDAVPLDPFFISKYEMTREQWNRARGLDATGLVPAMLPVTLTDWFETRAVLRRIGLDFPTEAQWEYAARGGTTTPWWTGTTPESLAGCEIHGGPRAQPVGQLRANGFGLHDVAGNVSEWCRDYFAQYGDDPRVAGDGERSGLDEVDLRIRRGGSFLNKPSELRSARRMVESPYARRADVGVRPARQCR